MFVDMLGKSMEVYIDDMLVKSLATVDHLNHLEQSFQHPTQARAFKKTHQVDMHVQVEKELLCLKEQSDSKWRLSVDGSSNNRGCGLGIVLNSPQGDVIQRAIKCDFKVTNNETEYEALLARLDLAKEMNIKTLEIMSDSQLIVNQFNGTY
uniref:RNase H type-1 domain-containing protein n=1 Tax=Cannabis sativa TaxID=3483 RepID=A0A803PS73_CANSA